MAKREASSSSSSSKKSRSSSELASIGEDKELSALVVDCNPVIGSVIRSVLSNIHGVESEVVKNGQEAVDLFRAGHRFDLVIMEMEMPVMDGIQATKEIREMGVKIFILGASGSDSEARIEEFKNSGVDVFMKKPLKTAGLTPIIRQLRSSE